MCAWLAIECTGTRPEIGHCWEQSSKGLADCAQKLYFWGRQLEFIGHLPYFGQASEWTPWACPSSALLKPGGSLGTVLPGTPQCLWVQVHPRSSRLFLHAPVPLSPSLPHCHLHSLAFSPYYYCGYRQLPDPAQPQPQHSGQGA